MAGAAPAEQPTAAQPPPAWRGPRHTRWFLVTFYALAVVWGVRNVRHAEPSGLDLLVPLALAAALGWWAIVDARRRRHPIPVLARPWFFLLAGLVVPGYVLWSRGWRGVGLVALHAALWYALATVAMHVGGVAVYGEEWLRAFGV
jgi:hypothetical protein